MNKNTFSNTSTIINWPHTAYQNYSLHILLSLLKFLQRIFMKRLPWSICAILYNLSPLNALPMNNSYCFCYFTSWRENFTHAYNICNRLYLLPSSVGRKEKEDWRVRWKKEPTYFNGHLFSLNNLCLSHLAQLTAYIINKIKNILQIFIPEFSISIYVFLSVV